MASTPPPTPDNSSNAGAIANVGRWLRKPSTFITAGGVVLVGTGLYFGGQQLAYRQGSPFLESELSRRLGRPVKVGDIEAFNFQQIRFGPSSLPPTADDATAISLEGINISVNPLLFLVGRPVEANITLIKPKVTLAQQPDGSWTTFEFPEERQELKLPIDVAANVTLDSAEVTIKPNALPKPLEIDASGTGGYLYQRGDNSQTVSYDVIASFAGSAIAAEGNTELSTFQSQTALEINRLDLPQLASLLPKSPVTVQSGNVNGNLNARLPSLQQIEQLRTLGEVDLTQLQARIDRFKAPLKAEFKLGFEGQQLLINQGQIQLGPLQAQVNGGIDYQKGYNLNVQTNEVDTKAFLDTVAVKLPVPLGGNVKANVNVRGKLSDPQIQGKLQNVDDLRIDKVALEKLETNFQANFDTVTVKSLQIQPQTGGAIQATASANWRLQDLVDSKKAKQWKWQSIPIKGKLTGAIATMPLLAAYQVEPDALQIGDLRLAGQAGGTLGKPLAQARWQTVNGNQLAGVPLSAQGKATLVGTKFSVTDTKIQSGEGSLTVSGQGDLQQNRWQAQLSTQQFALTPFVQAVCGLDQTPDCPAALRDRPLTVTAGQLAIKGSLKEFDPNQWQGAGQFQLQSLAETVSLQTRLQQGQVQANVVARNVAINPYVPQLKAPVNVSQLTAQTQFPLSPLLQGQLPLQTLSFQSQVRASVDNRPVTANASLRQGQLRTTADLRNISLNAFVPNLPVDARLLSGQVNATANLAGINTPQELIRVGVNRLQADSRLQLAVNGSPVTVKSDLNQGSLLTIADMGQIPLNTIAPQIPVPAQIDQGKITLTANVNDLLQSQPDLHRVQAIAAVDLTVAGGKVNSLTRLDHQQWQSQLNAKDVNLNPLLASSTETNPVALDPINAQATLAGNLNSLFTATGQLGAVPVQVKQARITAGEQVVTANGNLTLAGLGTQPRLSTVNFNVSSDLNFAQLPLNEVVAQLPLAPEFKPAALDLIGKAQFRGKLTGKNVTTLSGFKLAGNVQVQDLSLNDYAFEPRLAGPLSVQYGQPIQLALDGRQDRIAVNLQPCRGNCLAPYLPASFTLRQAYNRPQPIIATGQVKGNELQATIEHFPLAMLNVRPALRYNIPGALTGDVNATVAVNLRTGEGQGQLDIEEVTLGYLSATAVRADFALKNQIATLNQGSLVIGESEYNAQGSLNLKTQAIQARARVEQGQVQPLLAALRISDVDSLLRLAQLQAAPTTAAREIPPIDMGNPDQALEHQLNLLYLVDQQIIAMAQKYERGGVPTELTIEGRFDADITLGGTLKNPEAGVNFEGEHWSWYPQAPFPNIIPPEGLVINDTRFLPIQRLQLQAKLQNGQIQVLPSFIKINRAEIGAEGTLALSQSELQWYVKDFDLETLETFVALPADVAGRLNASGEIRGGLQDPQLNGEFNVDEIALNARPVPAELGGQFQYNNNQFQLVTSERSPIKINAVVPYYLNPKDAAAAEQPQLIKAEIGIPPEATELLDVITQEQVVWLGGSGEVQLNVQAEIDQSEGIKLANLQALGKASLNAAQIKSVAVPSPIQLDGDIVFNTNTISIENLTGRLDQSEVVISGVLPLFNPIPGLENPLQVAIKPTRLDIPNLYAGEVAGLIQVEGAALKPTVSGNVQLANGQVFVPQRPTEESSVRMAELRTRLGWFKSAKAQPVVVPMVDNLQISLENLYLAQEPLYEFSFDGELAVSGPVTDFSRLRADGAVQLNRGRVSVFDARFLLDRRSANTITFNPEQDLLNPRLDLAMRTIVSDLPQSARMRDENTNEYPDDTLNQIRRVDIRLNIDGNLGQLLPNLNPQYAAVCDPTVTFRPLPGVGSFDDFQLERLSRCIQILAARGFDDEQIFSNPALSLTSSPPRSEGEIVRLLGEQVIVLVDALQGSNSSQLLQVGITQLAIPMIFQGLVYDVETAISDTVKSTDFRVVPFLEAIYQVEQDGFVRFTYDYSFNQFRVRYETSF